MRLDRITIEGFKSIREMELELRPLNVLIGANGAGKSNFLTVFKLLNQMTQENLQRFVAQAGGADSLLHFGQKVTDEIRIVLEFGTSHYHCALLPTADDRLVFGEEEWFVAEENGRGWSAGSGRPESGLADIAEALHDKTSRGILSSIRNWRTYHLNDTSDSARVKKIRSINDNQYLRPDGENLAAFLYKLRHTARGQY